jgi:hypothetical protein
LGPSVTPAINGSLNPGLNSTQLATIAANLPVVNAFGPPPVLAIDNTLGLNFQTFMYPFTISFPNLNAFNALNPHQVAVVTLTAPRAYPSWLSFDLRLFKVTNQPHQMFSVPNPTSHDPSSPNGPIAYIQTVLDHLNNPSLITNGDTFDGTLTQDEDSSDLEFLPNEEAFVQTFNFAVARVRITSTVTTTIGPVRVFFRLFNAASTVSDFAEVGTGEGTYRWGSDGSPGHKIALLGVQGRLACSGPST